MKQKYPNNSNETYSFMCLGKGAVLGIAKTTLKFKCEILIGSHKFSLGLELGKYKSQLLSCPPVKVS